MNRYAFLKCLGGGIASPLLLPTALSAQPPDEQKLKEAKKEREKQSIAEINKYRTEIAALEKEVDKRDKKGFEKYQAYSRLAHLYLGCALHWEALEEWYAAHTSFRGAEDNFELAAEDSKRRHPNPSTYVNYDWSNAELGYARMEWRLGDFARALTYAESAKLPEGADLEKFKKEIPGLYFNHLADVQNLIARAYAAVGNFSKARESALAALQTRNINPKKNKEDVANDARLIGIIAYLQGDKTEMKSRWEEGSKIDGRFGEDEGNPFDPNQIPFNAAVAKTPTDVAARIARAKFFLDRSAHLAAEERAGGLTKAEEIRWKDAAHPSRGGWLNLLVINSSEPHSFAEAALLDIKVAQRINNDPANEGILYWYLYLAQSDYDKNAPKMRDKPAYILPKLGTFLRFALEYGKNDPNVLFEAGEHLAKLSSKRWQAIRLISQGLLIAPTHPKATLAAVRDALIKSATVVKVEPPTGMPPKTAIEWTERGNFHKSKDDWREALVCYDKAIALAPKFAEAYNRKGQTLVNIGCYDLAKEALDKAIALEPKHKTAYLGRALMWREAQFPEKVLSDTEKGIEYAQTPIIKGNGYAIKAHANLQLFRPKDALIDAIEAIKLLPDNASAWKAMGIAQMYLEQNGAATSLEKAGNSPDVGLLRCLAIILDDPSKNHAKSGISAAQAQWDKVIKLVKPSDLDDMLVFMQLWLESDIAPKVKNLRRDRLEKFYEDVERVRNL